MANTNLHEGHRERMREEFRTMGLESFQAHRVLELLLFYTIARRDTNPIAHGLLNHFGKSLRNVLEAPYEELVKVDGVGEASATLILLVAQLAKRYFAEQNLQGLSFDSGAAFHDYVKALYIGEKLEKANLLCLDNANRLLCACPISHGTKYTVDLDNRSLLEAAFRHGATKAVLAHNHPSGLAAPSKDDVAFTKVVARLFRSVEIQLLDHLIVAGRDCFSMASHPNFARIFMKNILPLKAQMAADVT